MWEAVNSGECTVAITTVSGWDSYVSTVEYSTGTRAHRQLVGKPTLAMHSSDLSLHSYSITAKRRIRQRTVRPAMDRPCLSACTGILCYQGRLGRKMHQSLERRL